MVKVLKLGGSILRSGFPEAFNSDLKALLVNDKAVLVHGGAAVVTETAEKMGKKQRFVVSPDGMQSRYTDRETMDIYTMVMAGKINKQVVAALISGNIPALGLTGADASLILAERKKRLIIIDERGRKMMIDGGYTGKIVHVRTDLIELILNMGVVPVLAPIAIDEKHDLLNVDSDRAAAYIAGTLKADALIFYTNVEGIMLDNTTIRRITSADAKKRLEEIGHGMRKKVYAGLEALDMGAKEVVIASGLSKQPISSALKHEAGTLIAP